MNKKVASFISWLALAVTLTVNALANIIPFNGYNTAQVSALYPNLFVPDGLTFSIWGIIYSLLLAFVVFATFLAFRRSPHEANLAVVQSIQILFWVSCGLNSVWMLAWHYLQLTLSLAIMVLLLVTLIAIFTRIVPEKERLSTAGRWLIILPFVVYLAWICVATIANTTALLVHAGWKVGLPPWVWSCIMIGIALLLALWMVFRWRQPAFALVIAWALSGIYREQHNAVYEIGLAAALGMGLCLLSIFIVLVPKKGTT
jgi:translocator protein